MVAVHAFSWEDISTPDFSNPARVAWRQAVAEIAAKAHAALPETVHGRLEKAVAIVLNGDVKLLEGGQARVASQSDGATHYTVCNGTCACRDFPRAAGGWYKHRLSAALYKRASPLDRAKLEAATSGQSAAPDQLMSVPAQISPAVPDTPGLPEGLKPFIVTLHGKPFVSYTGLLFLAHERGLLSLKAHFISVTPELALAEAEAIFADGKTYGECADSTPQNVGPTVRAHFPRIALTRAKARCLRDALNISVCSVEEMET